MPCTPPCHACPPCHHMPPCHACPPPCMPPCYAHPCHACPLPLVDRILDTCFWKYYLAPTSLRAVITSTSLSSLRENCCLFYGRHDFEFLIVGFCYRPQRTWGKVMFSQVCVKNSVHGGTGGVCLSACWDTQPPEHTPPPPGRHPSWGDFLYTDTPVGRHPSSSHCCSRRYAFYWNAVLLFLHIFPLL